MPSYKSYCWSLGTTSFRMVEFNKKIEEQLRLLNQFWHTPEYTDEKWSSNSAIQVAYYNFIREQGFIEEKDALRKDKDAREKTSGIENSCSVEYLKAQKAILEARLNKLNSEKIELQKEIESVEIIPDLLGENKVVDTEKKINYVLSSINIDIENIKIVLANVKEELDLVKKQIRDRLRHENEYIKQVYNLFVEYAKELNVEKTISPKEDYIFTDNLKCRTGANFQKLIIAYKIAVLKVVESVINKKLIFVMDSPKAKELDDNNTKQIMSFLKAKLSENQVLIASIYSEDELFTSFDKIIMLNEQAIEKR